MNTPPFRTTLATPIGVLRIDCDADSLLAIRFPNDSDDGTIVAGETVASLAVVNQLRRYFDGQLQAFDLPIALVGTPSQRAAWTALASIPFGTTVSYAELAHRLGVPKAVRAVGSANGRNPIPIVLPCHPVIGSDGTLHGFRGGLSCKSWLLAHEGVSMRERSALQKSTRKPIDATSDVVARY